MAESNHFYLSNFFLSRISKIRNFWMLFPPGLVDAPKIYHYNNTGKRQTLKKGFPHANKHIDKNHPDASKNIENMEVETIFSDSFKKYRKNFQYFKASGISFKASKNFRCFKTLVICKKYRKFFRCFKSSVYFILLML